jgi:hypothetical protein|tara:strand:- start:20 stop:166 length:147 start_codon:yes stop_codon:yes gene_type:complete
MPTVTYNNKFTKFYVTPYTIGLWRPMEVEIGFIEDYIKITNEKNKVIR